MNGMEILALEEVVVKYVFNWDACWIAVGIIMGLAILIGALSCIDSCWEWHENILCAVVVGVLIAAFAGGLFGVILEVPTEYETQYKVTISDEIKMNEFSEKYEIVNQDGKIYTIRERNLVDDYDE